MGIYSEGLKLGVKIKLGHAWACTREGGDFVFGIL